MEILESTYLLRFTIFFILFFVVSGSLFMTMWRKILSFVFFRMFIGPGIIIHESSHALGCLITGAKINSIQFFNRKGGKVVHGPAKIKFIGPVIISMAPIFGGLAILLFLNWFLGNPFQEVGVGGGAASTFVTFFNSFIHVDWLDWKTWFYIYCVINLLCVMGPSKKDFKNCFIGLLGISIILFWIEFSGLVNGKEVSAKLLGSLWADSGIIAASLLISIPLYFLAKNVK